MTRQITQIIIMGIDQGDGGQVPPPKLGVGDANANCPLRFCYIGTKRSVMWPSKYAKIHFLTTLPRSPSLLGRGHPSYAPPRSAPTHLQRSPYVLQNSRRIYACAQMAHNI